LKIVFDVTSTVWMLGFSFAMLSTRGHYSTDIEVATIITLLVTTHRGFLNFGRWLLYVPYVPDTGSHAADSHEHDSGLGGGMPAPAATTVKGTAPPPLNPGVDIGPGLGGESGAVGAAYNRQSLAPGIVYNAGGMGYVTYPPICEAPDPLPYGGWWFERCRRGNDGCCCAFSC
jgi:hypothetical protein